MAKKKSKPRSTSSRIALPQTDRDYKIRNGLSTLREAEVIRGDTRLMKDIRVAAKKEQTALGKIVRKQ